MWRLLRGLIWLITVGRVDLDREAPPDYTKDELKLKESLRDCEAKLKEAQAEKLKVEGEIAALEQQVKVCAAEGRKSGRQTLANIKAARDELAIIEARETMLCRKISAARTQLAMIKLYEDSKPLEMREEVRKISDRMKVRIDTIAQDQDEIEAGASDVREDVAISELHAELDKIETEILQREALRRPPQVEAAVDAIDEQPATPRMSENIRRYMRSDKPASELHQEPAHEAAQPIFEDDEYYDDDGESYQREAESA